MTATVLHVANEKFPLNAKVLYARVLSFLTFATLLYLSWGVFLLWGPLAGIYINTV